MLEPATREWMAAHSPDALRRRRQAGERLVHTLRGATQAKQGQRTSGKDDEKKD